MSSRPDFHVRRLRQKFLYVCFLVALCFAGLLFWTAERVRASSAPVGGAYRSDWSPGAAATYLDSREVWWQSWPAAQRSQGTVCVSCHTVLPYALVRPALRGQLHQTGLTSTENRMLNSIETRVTDWQQMKPYYDDSAHAAPSRATEAVLNAMILAAYDSESNRLRPVTLRAFDEAWALQENTGQSAGGWEWQDFHEAPWESTESGYQGAAMMAIALGRTPSSYRSELSVRGHVEALREYLQRRYTTQPVMNQLYVLWASAEMPGLLTDSQRADLVTKVAALQQADGGWSLSSLDKQKALKPSVLDLFKRAVRDDGSDGCATGLAVLALEESGVESQNQALRRGLTWLGQSQHEDGSWWASSMNGFRDPASYTGRFMSDAATGYAVLALEEARNEGAGPPPSERASSSLPQFQK